ncbi:multidrug ABC transporter permease [Bombiscardovia apis]|uniref:Multidrug ABC transporter permease n=1 Tax=Bombiscardovia apis TaxID=2932182 RepID=A0ABM8BBH6_9BIFI|nr:ABC transporter permease [Bombiscardovia apis]BDR54161.1 multidrug ABC transporter permease [Bombiscardovia apis]
MWNSFKLNVKTATRNPSALFWVLTFPVILAAMLMGMIGNIQDDYTIAAQPFSVVNDSNWQANRGAQELVKAISGEAKSSKSGEDTTSHLIDSTAVSSASEARQRLNRQQDIGYIYADDAGQVNMVLSSKDAAEIQSDSSATKGITVSIMASSFGRLNQTGSALAAVAKTNPRLLANPSFQAQILSGNDTYTRQIRLTHLKPTVTAPYFFAVLGMACLLGASTTAAMIGNTQPNLSALGARRSTSPQPKWLQASGAFLASWLFSFVSLLVAYVFIRTVCKVESGGRDLIALVAITIGTFMSTAFGTLVGSIPKVPLPTKMGLTVALDCTLSVFAGLYGTQSMDINYAVAERAPFFHLINPVKQVANLFYDIVYYDSLAPFARTCGILALMSALFLAGAAILLRRQRYEYL